MCRTILLTLALLVLATTAAFAAPVPAAPQGGCAPSLGLLAPSSPAVCKAPAAPSTAPAQPEFMTSSTVFRGFCRCSCTHIPDCNTSADCGGSACLKAITCC
jgi:hypothetical protein